MFAIRYVRRRLAVGVNFDRCHRERESERERERERERELSLIHI